ncbi:ergothioneine biosynthesis protein EgtC [Saccharomonospora sp. CUA-673]|uniref:ergothioneine biosynthesis protein EgtC n=1 Tax=Saccharomonospora sp. CUA-673 TaxID=1904969 RepID=UPI000959A32E|nr:ergothioneine biosynthesis protein EgtC [Saccharomonospora sp. CUA-673]OLT43137.1 ergothioneine biosynthesis protein EgtC [Saccharomonospora sp. CUA-673]
MCRHVAYLGPEASPAHAVVDAPHSLSVQAHAPRDMRGGGTVNADGFGFAWIAADGAPVRYRRARPLWTDETAPRLARSVRSSAFVGAVRSGTPGMPVEEAACAPMLDGTWMFSHNGVVRGWPDSVADLAATLPTTDLLRLESRTDSALLWALLRRRLASGGDPAAEVARLVSDVDRAAPGSRLNLLIAAPGTLIATTWTHSLALRATSRSVELTSEPYDEDDGWRQVPDRSLVTARCASGPGESDEVTVTVEAIDEGGATWQA